MRCRFRDKAGNESSDSSFSSTLTTAELISGDIGDDEINSQHYASLSILSAHIGNAQITTAKIGNAQITNALIANLAVDTAQIANLAVETLQVNGQAINELKRRVVATATATGQAVTFDSQRRALWDRQVTHSLGVTPIVTVRATFSGTPGTSDRFVQSSFPISNDSSQFTFRSMVGSLGGTGDNNTTTITTQAFYW